MKYITQKDLVTALADKYPLAVVCSRIDESNNNIVELRGCEDLWYPFTGSVSNAGIEQSFVDWLKGYGCHLECYDYGTYWIYVNALDINGFLIMPDIIH